MQTCVVSELLRQAYALPHRDNGLPNHESERQRISALLPRDADRTCPSQPDGCGARNTGRAGPCQPDSFSHGREQGEA